MMFGLPNMLGLKVAAIAGVVAWAVGTAGGAYAGYRWELGAYQTHLTADAQAMSKAVKKAADDQRRIDLLNQGDATEQAYFRGRMDAQTVNLVLGVPANVTVSQDEAAAAADRVGCVSLGFVRLLVAGERGVPAESLQLPSGQSVDACTAYEPSALAAAVAQDLASGAGNSHQLDALIAAVKRNDAIATTP
jgi:hypothetical protein